MQYWYTCRPTDSNHAWRHSNNLLPVEHAHIKPIAFASLLKGYTGTHEPAATYAVEDDDGYEASQEKSTYQVRHRWLKLLRHDVQELFQKNLVLRDGAEHYVAYISSSRL